MKEKERNQYIFSKKCLLILLYLYFRNDVKYTNIMLRSFGFHFDPDCNFKVIIQSKNDHTHKYTVRIYESLGGCNLESADVMGNINIIKVDNIDRFDDFYKPKASLNIYFDEVRFLAEGYIEGKFFTYKLKKMKGDTFVDDLLYILTVEDKTKNFEGEDFLLWLLKFYNYCLPTDLVFGAGINCDYGAKDWKGLIKSLNKEFYKSNEKAIDDTKHYVGNELFVASKVLKTNGFDIYKSLNHELYQFEEARSFNDPNSTLYKCVDYIEKHPGTTVITYNYDTNLEYLLRKRDIFYTTVYDESSFAIKNSVCTIYHVHGLLPYDKFNEEKFTSSLVFSESEYFNLYNNPYSWNISKQLHDFSFNVCLFIGISLTDPNMKRLLELSSNPLKFNFIFIKKEKEILGPVFKDLTNYYFTYDLIPIWIDNYDEIGAWLNRI